MIYANKPDIQSWIPVPEKSDFPIQNIPFGIFSTEGTSPRPCTRVGDTVVDLSALANTGMRETSTWKDAGLCEPTLNLFLSKGKKVWREIRDQISFLVNTTNTSVKDNEELKKNILFPFEAVKMHLPVTIGDYTDFYSSIEHATNLGIMFRDPENALLPNWKHIPVGYHGRSSSIVVSGTPIRRPMGQTRPDDNAPPMYGPTRLLDFELEVAFVVGTGNELGNSIPIAKAEDHIFGLCLFNDWSARDIQKWEYIPLGPFLGKNFGSTVSPWLVTLDALKPFRVHGPAQDPSPLPYLQTSGAKNFDIQLEVSITPKAGEENVVSRSNFKYMYWNMSQQLAHHTMNGCNMRPGDMCASGTISGPEPGSYGSMIEISWKGTKPVQMSDGSERKFIHDGDSVTMKGFAEKDGLRIGFGEVKSEILPAQE